MTLHAGRIPVLTLHRPWPALILHAGKRVENRAWRTHYRGPIFLHAGQRWDDAALDFAATIPMPEGTTAADWVSQFEQGHPIGIVGLARLTATRLNDPSPWAITGQCQWILDEQVHAFAEPVPCKGKQGLWAAPPDLWPALTTALETLADR